jgi:hypothetical protein
MNVLLGRLSGRAFTGGGAGVTGAAEATRSSRVPAPSRAQAVTLGTRRRTIVLIMFWQLTIDANDPARLARFWRQALGYQPAPPPSAAPWAAHYRGRLGAGDAFDDRLFDPEGQGPPLWFQEVPEAKAGKNRLHLDLYPTGRDDSLPIERRVEIVEAKVAELLGLGARVDHRERGDDPDDSFYFVVLHDPEGNEFCVS